MQSLSYYNLKKKSIKKGTILVAGFFNQKRGYSIFIVITPFSKSLNYLKNNGKLDITLEYFPPKRRDLKICLCSQKWNESYLLHERYAKTQRKCCQAILSVSCPVKSRIGKFRRKAILKVWLLHDPVYLLVIYRISVFGSRICQRFSTGSLKKYPRGNTRQRTFRKH